MGTLSAILVHVGTRFSRWPPKSSGNIPGNAFGAGLAPSHPAHRLSKEALERIWRERDYARDYLARSGANDAKVRAAIHALCAFADELLAVSEGIELWRTMEGEMDAAAVELGLTQSEKSVVWAGLKPRRFLYPRSTTQASIEATIGPVAESRRSWMDERHPGWSLVQWKDHTGAAYETLKKYWNGTVTTQTRNVRQKIAEAEKVAFPAVPE